MNPFTEDVFCGALAAEPNLSTLYEREIQELTETILHAGECHQEYPTRLGSTVLLTSPSAGAGKTHLLARLLREHGTAAHFFELALANSEELRWSNWFRQMMESFHTQCDPQSHLSFLTLRTASLIASGAEAVVARNHLAGAPALTEMQWLRENSQALFQHSENPHATVSWLRKQSGELLPQIANHFSRTLPFPPDLLETSLNFLYQYALLALASTDQDRRQDQYLRSATILNAEEKASSDRSKLQLFGRLLTLEAPVAPIIDEIDWIYRDQTSALDLARLIVDLRKLVPNSVALLCANRDTWQETFERGLPEAMRDRLTSHTCELNGIPRNLWSEFLHTRAQSTSSHNGEAVSLLAGKLSDTHPKSESLMPRKLLRAASKLWAPPVKWEETAPAFTEPAPPKKVEPALPVVDQPSSLKDSENTSAWTVAMDDLRTLLQNRAKSSPDAPSSPPSVTLPSQSDTNSAAASHPPAERPEITSEFRSFISQIRERALEKRGNTTRTQETAHPEQEAERPQTPSFPRPGEAAQPAQAPPPNNGHNGTPHSQGPSPTPTALTPGKINTRLRQFKLEYAQSPNPIDLTRFRRLISTAGAFFPAVAQEAVGAPADTNGELRWRFQQSEVNFGFRPYDDTPYWQRLNAATALRARELRERDMTRVKLVVFGRRPEEGVFAAWNSDKTNASNLQFCDVVFLTDHQLTVIYAIDRLLAEEVDPAAHTAVFAQVSGELNFLWKMITRPVWTLVSQLNRTSH